jgi:S1-C subfamily serine protease
MTKLKDSIRMIGAFAALYVLVWFFGKHGHSHFLEPAKQNGTEWACPPGQDGPFEENGKGRDPVCHVPVRECPVLLLPFASQTPCTYKDPLGGPWTDEDQFDLESLKHKQQTLSPVELFQRVSPSVFVVEALDENGKPLMLGSGVAMARDFLITNCHVVQSCSSLRVSRGKENWTARLIQAVPGHDLCGLRPSGFTLRPVEVRPSSKLATGEHVYAIGSPEGLELTFSEGVISALRETEGVHMIQTSAPISPGSSGGGLFDAHGNLVGITSFQLREGQSLNFAIPGEWVSGMLSSSTEAAAKSSTRFSDAELESRAWLEIGLEAVKKEDYDLAVHSFRKCADLKQSDASRAWLELGHIDESANSYTASDAYKAWLQKYSWSTQEVQERAVAAFEKALELKPDCAEAWRELAWVHWQRNEYDQAISAAKEDTRLAPRDWWGWRILGNCYVETASYAEAIDALQQGEKVAPEESKSLMLDFLGAAYAKKGDRDQVLRIYRELKGSDPKMAEKFLRKYVLPTRGDNASPKFASKTRGPALSPAATKYKGQIEEFIMEKGLSGCISLRGTGNTVFIEGRARPAEHGALLKFLRNAPSDVRVIDHLEYDDSPKTPCR